MSITVDEALAYIYRRIGKTAPIAKSMSMEHNGLIKSFVRDDGTVGIEGFISTPKQDIEKDILEPEAFSGDALTAYMQRGAPISTEHNTRDYPVGYVTKAMLIRDSEVLQEELNPKHDFRGFQFYNGGTGWYGSAVIYEPDAARAVVRGTVGSFSWIGMPKLWNDIPGGGRHFKQAGGINPLIEVTVTAYPINTAATMRIAKARGALPTTTLSDLAMLMSMDDGIAEDIIQLLAPGISERAQSAYADVLTLASLPAGHKVHDYFKE